MADPVQIFREAVDALNRVDRAALQRLVDPEVAFVPMRAAVTGAFLGYAGIEDFLADNEQKYEYFLAEFDTLEVLPDGRLLSIGTIRVRGKGGEDETCVTTAGIPRSATAGCSAGTTTATRRSRARRPPRAECL